MTNRHYKISLFNKPFVWVGLQEGRQHPRAPPHPNINPWPHLLQSRVAKLDHAPDALLLTCELY